MIKVITDYLEKTVEKYPNKLAFADKKRETTYEELQSNAKKIGTKIIKNNYGNNKPIAIYLDKEVECVESMLGVVYSGNFYTVLDSKSPKERIDLILNTLNPKAIITNSKCISKVKELLTGDTEIITYEECMEETHKTELLKTAREKIIDTNPMYILFTSGSTGVPKGTVVSHRAVITYSNWVVDTFDISNETIFGSQTPFYFSMSITDVFSTIITGATFYIIPKMYFSFPIKLLEFLNEKKVNTIYWVPSALCIVANFGTLEEIKLEYLKKVMFAGEVMPMKQLNMWRKKFPDVMFANLYGPTETTVCCTAFIYSEDKTDGIVSIGKEEL